MIKKKRKIPKDLKKRKRGPEPYTGYTWLEINAD